MNVKRYVELSTTAIEVAGVSTIVFGAVLAAFLVWRRQGFREPLRWYTGFRRNLGRAILLGLEFLVAADIIRTVAQVPSLVNVTALGLIVLIRTLLSFTLQMEVEGRAPWQARPPEPPPPEKLEEPGADRS